MAVFTGTSGDDDFTGTNSGDDFHLEQGGEDSASGKAGVDIFYMGATFDAGDRLNGGGGVDIVKLDGDYSVGVVIGAALDEIETIQLAAGHSYALSGFSGQSTVDGSALGVGDWMVVDASANGSITINGGLGDDKLTGGAGGDSIFGGGGHDVLSGGAGDDILALGAGKGVAKGGAGNDSFSTAHFTVADKFVGGDGQDVLTLAIGVDGPISMKDTTIQGIETLRLANQAFHVVMADGNVAGSQVLAVDASQAEGLIFNGAAETDGGYLVIGSTGYSDTITGGEGRDTLNGGGADDALYGGDGKDRLFGGFGADKLVGGLGADVLSGGGQSDRFVYTSVQDSTAAAPDLISGVGGGDQIDLHNIDADTTQDGDQAFHLVSAFTGSAGELVVQDDIDRHQTTVLADVDGDGSADLVIDIKGDHGDFTNFVL